MKINEVAKLTGVTVRTLHYYDEIGLLSPDEVSDAGYRLYHQAALAKLRQILFFRELAFPLKEIVQIMENPKYSKRETLEKQCGLLVQQRKRLDQLIELAEKSIKGENDMDFKAFDKSAIEASKAKYAQEVKQRWGTADAYRESEQKTAAYDNAQWAAVGSEGESIMKAFAKTRTQAPGGEQAEALVKRWQDFITKSYYRCDKKILACLGRMYVGDERFTKSIDEHGEGTAAFMAAAIENYCAKE